MIQNLIREYNIPVVEQHGSVDDPKAFMQYVHELKNAEGFVIRWGDGHRVKIKAHEYLQIHKAKEAILQDRNIVELILDDKLDDVKAHLPAEDRNRLSQFESDFNLAVAYVTYVLANELQWIRDDNIDRKTFAIEHAGKYDQYMRALIFKNFEELSHEKYWADVRNTIRNNLTKTVKYEAIRDVWFNGVVYNETY